jgi:hypothetical protein
MLAMSFVSIWAKRRSSQPASLAAAAGTTPRERAQSTMAAHSMALPRAMAKKWALSDGDRRPQDSAQLSGIERLARVSWSRSSRAPAWDQASSEGAELERDTIVVETLGVDDGRVVLGGRSGGV